jgi:zinc/manganese transport system ATP-binding protein
MTTTLRTNVRTTLVNPDPRVGTVPLIDVREVTVQLGNRTVLEEVSAQIWRNEFVGVLGPNGAGKSTLLRVLLGLLRPAKGEVFLQGEPLRRGNPRIGYCPQHRAFDRDLPMTAREFAGLGLDGHRWGLGLPSKSRRVQIEAMLEAVGARAFADAPLGQLSGGEQQRLAIAQALLGEPSLLLLDEPLASLDVRSQREIVELVDRVRRERQLAVLFVTHGVNPLLGVMDRVWYLAGGHAAIGPVSEVIRSDVLSRLYGVPVEVIEVQGQVFVSSPDEWSHHRGKEERK